VSRGHIGVESLVVKRITENHSGALRKLRFRPGAGQSRDRVSPFEQAGDQAAAEESSPATDEDMRHS